MSQPNSEPASRPAAAGNQANGITSIRVWDPFVRLFHWSLVLLMATEYLSGEAGKESLHFIAGYLLIPLLVMRLAWGFIGTPYAQFRSFLFSPRVTLAYLVDIVRGHPRRYLGHNPAGAIMVYLLLALTLLTLATGLVCQATIEFEGPLVELLFRADDETAALFSRLHSICVNTLLILVPAHILGVVVAGFQHREKLILSMITGDKQLEG